MRVYICLFLQKNAFILAVGVLERLMWHVGVRELWRPWTHLSLFVLSALRHRCEQSASLTSENEPMSWLVVPLCKLTRGMLGNGCSQRSCTSFLSSPRSSLLASVLLYKINYLKGNFLCGALFCFRGNVSLMLIFKGCKLFLFICVNTCHVNIQ